MYPKLLLLFRINSTLFTWWRWKSMIIAFAMCEIWFDILPFKHIIPTLIFSSWSLTHAFDIPPNPSSMDVFIATNFIPCPFTHPNDELALSSLRTFERKKNFWWIKSSEEKYKFKRNLPFAINRLKIIHTSINERMNRDDLRMKWIWRNCAHWNEC